MTRWTAAAWGALVATVVVPVPISVAAPPVDEPAANIEAALQQRIERLEDRQRPGAPQPTVTVELLLDDGSVADTVRDLGGRVTAETPGSVALAVVPTAVVDELADLPEVVGARLPRVVNRLEVDESTFPRTRTESFGPTAGQGPLATAATAWLGAGINGSGVKVGVIDFFDLRVWNPLEHGPAPIPGVTMFCSDSSGSGFCSSPNVVNSSTGDRHGVAVVEIVKDMAPGAQIYIATAGTLTDTRAALDWFHANGVRIITRSLGAAYDGPGDGTGPLAAEVDHAASLGMVWFNSAGNDANGKYARFGGVGVDANRLVVFPGGTTALPITGLSNGCAWLDGVRWNNPAVRFTIEYATTPSGSPFSVSGTDVEGYLAGTSQGGDFVCPPGGTTLYLRLRANTATPPPGLRVEVGLTFGRFPNGFWQAEYSAAKPAVDSKNPLLLAVGAIDPPFGSGIGFYSSQGPTNDERKKPDLSAPAGVSSSLYAPQCFQGTSAASPVAAGAAALLLSANPGWTGGQLAAAMRQQVVDLGPPGLDNVFGAGGVRLRSPYGAERSGVGAGAVALQQATRLTAGC